MIAQKRAHVETALVESTPDEQEDILIMANNDWRAWLAKHGQEDSIEEVAVNFDMRAEDIAAGIGEGLVTDTDALREYGERALREARDKLNYETVGSDTEEQGAVSSRAYEAYTAAERQLEPVLKGTQAEKVAFCARMAERATAEAVPGGAAATFATLTNWYKMAARVAGAAI